MARKPVELIAGTKVRNALSSLTFYQKVHVLATALKEVGLPMAGAQLISTLNEMGLDNGDARG